jgi:mycothiol synthase
MDGYTTRAPVAEDAEAIFAVANAADLADAGVAEWSLADVRNELAHSTGTLVCDGDGTIVAFALVHDIDADVEVHPRVRGQGIGAFLVKEVDGLANGTVIRQEIMSVNHAAREILEAAGYEQEQRYWRMDRPLDGRERPPAWPDDLTARRYERGRDDRAAYELVSDAMSAIPGDTERSFEQWQVRALGEGLVPELSTVVGDMAGIALCQRPTSGEGYIDYLAVAPGRRGRGLGRALLDESFALFAAEGMTRAVLWVNGRNESATRLYRNAGMEETLSGDRLVKPLRP